jgi:hypothetical protein
MAAAAWVLLMREPAAILSIKSALFIFAPEQACRSRTIACAKRLITCASY